MPHNVFGWTLKPSRSTRLRWQGYDYVVTSNALGFPAGKRSPASPDAFRIMTVGDAFTSAEGVDTHAAWPRLLERELSRHFDGKREVEVLNFGITGYNTKQFASVVEAYGPIIRPHLIIVQMFLNDFDAAPENWRDSWSGIGFGKPAPDSVAARLQFPHLAKYLRAHVTELIIENTLGWPRRTGYFLGGFAYLERDARSSDLRRIEATETEFQRIQTTAAQIGATVNIILAPSAPQVCDPAELPYFPATIDLSDSTAFDMDQPQRMAAQLAARHGFAFVDLRDPLRKLAHCPYHPENMHWLAAGHRAVADHLIDTIASTTLPPGSMLSESNNPSFSEPTK